MEELKSQGFKEKQSDDTPGFHPAPIYGPIVYRLGRQVLILERGVRLPLGLQIKIGAGRVLVTRVPRLRCLRQSRWRAGIPASHPKRDEKFTLSEQSESNGIPASHPTINLSLKMFR